MRSVFRKKVQSFTISKHTQVYLHTKWSNFCSVYNYNNKVKLFIQQKENNDSIKLQVL